MSDGLLVVQRHFRESNNKRKKSISMPCIKELFKKIKMRFLPPSSRSFYREMGELNAKVQALDSALRQVSPTDNALSLSLNEYKTGHLFRLERLRAKVKANKTVKVFFLISYAAKFESKSVYNAMVGNPLYEPYIFIVHPRDALFTKEPVYYEEAQKNYELFIERGYKTIFGYDDRMRPLIMQDLNPDIIFYSNPNLYQASYYSMKYLNANYLTCYIPYYYSSESIHSSHFAYLNKNANILSAWKVFKESYYAFQAYIREVQFAPSGVYMSPGSNAVLSGYPKLDVYAKDESLLDIPEKLCNGNPTVIYAPHWTINTSSHFSTFHLFHQQFLDMLDLYPNVNFVFKPHPDLKNRLIDMQKKREPAPLTPEEYDAYIQTWDNKRNGLFVWDGEYIDLFRKSSLLITDCGSFISEYFPSGNPCIYIFNPQRKNPWGFYNELAHEFLDGYYLHSDWDGIESQFRSIIIDEDDPKYEYRQDIIKKEFINLGTAGQYICNYITRELTDE